MCATSTERIEDGVIFSNDAAVGLLKPSTLWGKDQEGNFYISGPSGAVKTTEDDVAIFWQALVAADAILFGTESEAKNCQRLLKNPETSRTASFFMTTSKNCADLISKIKKIQDGKVLIVGCGGIGSLAAFNLAGAGVANLHFIDGDTVELSNLNRQFFWMPHDEGKKKVHVLQREIRIRHPKIKCEAFDEYILDEEIQKIATSFDVVLLTADEPLGLGNALASCPGLLIIGGGYIHQHVSFGINESRLRQGEKITWHRTPFFIGPSFGPTNTELAGIASSYAIQFLAETHPKILNSPFGSIWDSTEFPRKINSTTECHER